VSESPALVEGAPAGVEPVDGAPPVETPSVDSEPPVETPSDGSEPADSPEATPLPALQLRDGLPGVTETAEDLARVVRDLQAGTGPIAVDTERASGYRYGQRAYLIQIRREGSGTSLIDPHALPGVPGLAEALTGPEWILHAASQDLPCLAELGLFPTTLFDTELAGRLLGMPRVGLGPMVQDVLGLTLAKGHGAADWSRRPLPQDWLEYAALDVEVLIELRTELRQRLERSGKLAWAEQEFAAVRDAPPPPPRVDPWRRTSGIHRIRSRRALAIVEHLWVARDRIGQEVDTAPGRLLPDSSIVAAAQALPRDLSALQATKAFHGRGASRYQRAWGAALRDAWAVPEKDLPLAVLKSDGPPPPRVWAQRDPIAAARLDRARTALKDLSEQVAVPVENLLTPDLVRRVMWQPPEGAGAMAAALRAAGARPWQVELTAGLLEEALTSSPA
jgi:ribonuclease D